MPVRWKIDMGGISRSFSSLTRVVKSKDNIGVHRFVYKRKKKVYGYLLKVLQYISAYHMNYKIICIVLYINTSITPMCCTVLVINF